MPRVSCFYGITIWIYYDEIQHPGRPHFHARYGQVEASIDIESLVLIAGDLPPRARRLVFEWAREHQVELQDNWGRVAPCFYDLADRHCATVPGSFRTKSVRKVSQST